MDIHQPKELLQRYQAGNSSPSENELVEDWYMQLVDTGEWQWGKGKNDMMQKVIDARINQLIWREEVYFLLLKVKRFLRIELILSGTTDGTLLPKDIRMQNG